MPEPVILRAKKRLIELESPALNANTSSAKEASAERTLHNEPIAQADLFARAQHPIVDALSSLKLDNMTPKQALDWLYECKKRI